MGECGENEVNPFRHRLVMTTCDYLTSILCGIILIPIRLVLVVSIILVAWVGAAIFTSERFRNPDGVPNSKLRLKVYEILLKALGWSLGFVVSFKGDFSSKDTCPIFVAASHSSFFDALVVPYLGMPVSISREENKHIPLVGPILVLGQCIFLKREDSQSKRLAAQNINDWIVNTSSANSPSKSDQKLLIFAEGYNSNRTALLPFKTGAFRSGRPVQPVLVSYPNRLDTVTWTWDQPHGALAVALFTLSRPYTRIQIEMLPVYHPSPVEKLDAKLYAENVRQLMAKSLKIPASNLTSQDVQELRTKIIGSRSKQD